MEEAVAYYKTYRRSKSTLIKALKDLSIAHRKEVSHTTLCLEEAGDPRESTEEDHRGYGSVQQSSRYTIQSFNSNSRKGIETRSVKYG